MFKNTLEKILMKYFMLELEKIKNEKIANIQEAIIGIL